ncbi:hypothetical protein RB195_025317 [Necator americanus]|uniref:Uncharacterized protein n=1 Tax=Necator americanus TaxID=51031 RepID=A0ABR1ERW1_NECAM
MNDLSCHDELIKPPSLLIPLKAAGFEVKFSRRSSGANFGVEITNYDLIETGVEPHLLLRKRPIRVVCCSKESMLSATFALTRTTTPLLSHVPKNSSSPRLGQSDDVALKLPGLHHQIFNSRVQTFGRCKSRSSS